MLFLFGSCARMGYYVEQGLGQIKIQWKGEENKKILKDPRVADEIKNKIRQIEKYKKFFYEYFNIDPSNIYSKTTFLDYPAVSYLVVASRPTEIKAKEFDFIIVGTFPYIGFFNKKTAEDFKKDLEEEDYVTWMRPIYAYSTLGHLEDRILSSFFHYDEFELAELIFHELVHTIYFVEDEVEINENLATFMSHLVLKEYYKADPRIAIFLKQLDEETKLQQVMVAQIHLLQREFDKLGPILTPEKANDLTQRFIQGIFLPRIEMACEEFKWPRCSPLENTWNQAAFAALLTYEEEQLLFSSFVKINNMTPREFFQFLMETKKEFSSQKNEKSFLLFLKQKVQA